MPRYNYLTPSYAGPSQAIAEAAKISADQYDKSRDSFDLMTRTQAALLANARDQSSRDYINDALNKIKATTQTLATDKGIAYESGLGISRDLANQFFADPTFAAIQQNSQRIQEYETLRRKLIAETGSAVELGMRPEDFQTITKDKDGKQVLNYFDSTPQQKGNYAGVMNDIVKSVKPERREQMLQEAKLWADESVRRTPALLQSTTVEELAASRFNDAMLKNFVDEYRLKSEGQQHFNVLTNKRYDGLDEATATRQLMDQFKGISNKYLFHSEANQYMGNPEFAAEQAAKKKKEEEPYDASKFAQEEATDLVNNASGRKERLDSRDYEVNKKGKVVPISTYTEGRATFVNVANGVSPSFFNNSDSDKKLTAKQKKDLANLETFRKSNPKYKDMDTKKLVAEYNAVYDSINSVADIDAEILDPTLAKNIAGYVDRRMSLDQPASKDRIFIPNAPNPKASTVREQLGMEGKIEFVPNSFNFASLATDGGGGIKGKFVDKNGKEVEAIVKPNKAFQDLFKTYNDAHKAAFDNAPGYEATKKEEIIPFSNLLESNIGSLGIPVGIRLKNKVGSDGKLAPVYTLMVKNGDGKWEGLSKSEMSGDVPNIAELRKRYGYNLELNLKQLRDLTTKSVFSGKLVQNMLTNSDQQ